MNVLKIVIVSLFFVRLFGLNFYVPQDFNISNIKDKKSLYTLNFKKYKNIKTIDFNNSLALLSYNDLPFIFENNLTIITPIGKIQEYILTDEKSLCKIKTIAKLDFASKIVLDVVNKHYKAVKGNLKDLLNGKIDALVSKEDKDIEGIFDFPLSLYGIDFNRYFVVGSKSFIKKHYKKIEQLNEEFENSFDFRKDLIYKTLLISSLYLHKHIPFHKLLFEDYKLKKEKNEEYVKVLLTGNWPPFQIAKDGHIYGIAVDFWKLIAKKAHIKYKFLINPSFSENLKAIKEKKADLLISTSATPDRKKYAIFSKSYASFPLAVICRNDENFNSINDIKTLAVGKNFTAEKLMKEHFPNLNYIETKNTYDALNLVKEKKADCAVDILPTILWIINKNHFMNMQISFRTPFKFNVQMMARNDYTNLIKKINKAINEITPMQKEKIINKYLGAIIIQKSPHYYRYVLIVAGIIFIIIVVVLIIRNKKIEKDAMYDELTGILNRRGVYERLKDEKGGSILFFDIDHFKNINDTYGHEFGDYVLKELGKILKSSFRKSDIVGRWGGEEFIVILPHTTYNDALKIAEKLRRTIENHDFKGKKVTVSIGITEYKGDLEENLKKADEALYEAKNSGRNQIKGKK